MTKMSYLLCPEAHQAHRAAQLQERLRRMLWHMNFTFSRKGWFSVFLFPVIVGASACSGGSGEEAKGTGATGGVSDGGDGDGDGPGDGDSGGDGDSVGAGGAGGEECEGERPDGAICVTEVRGLVVNELDEPVSDLAVTVCGPVCHRAVTDSEGQFSVAVNSFLLVSEYSVQPHGSPGASTFYYRLPADLEEGSYDAGTLRVVEFPTDGTVLTTKLDLDGETPPAQDAQSGDVSISVAEGTVVRLSVADALEGDEGRRFRARELDDALVEEFVPDLDAERVFALGPFEAEFMGDAEQEPAVSLSVINSEGWEAGTEVQVLALGTYLDLDWLAPSEFEAIGTATVSSDGMTIDLPSEAAGPGLRHLTWIALRR